MNKEDLIAALKFMIYHKLTPREIKILSLFMDKDYSNENLAIELKEKKSTLHHILQKLKSKNLLRLRNTGKYGAFIYEFNPDY